MPHFASSSDGCRIAFETRGSGSPALVFVHGWSCNRGHWSAQITTFSSDALVVAIDLAGHGDSDAVRKDWAIGSFGADVCAVVDALSLDDVIVIGHSMGANVALEASRSLSGRVRGIVWVDQYDQLDSFMDDALIESRLEPFRTDFVAAADAFARRLFASSASRSLVDAVSLSMASAPQHVALPSLEATFAHGSSVPALLAELRLPVVAINSRITDIASLQRHGIDVILMSGVGHFPMLEDPRQFDQCLSQAIARLTHVTRHRDSP